MCPDPLDRLITRQRWVASASQPHARSHAAIRAGKTDALASDGRRTAEVLIDSATRHPDAALRQTAAQILTTMRNPEAQQCICEYAFEHDSEPAVAAAIATGFLPEDSGQRAALLFLAGDFRQYRELDFDGQLLLAVLTAAGPVLRARRWLGSGTSTTSRWIGQRRDRGSPTSSWGDRHA